MNLLNDFQNKVIYEIERLISQLGLVYKNWEVIQGKSESYVRIDFGNFRVWIYIDDLEISIGKDSMVLEHYDYESEDQHIKDFLQKFKKIAKEKKF